MAGADIFMGLSGPKLVSQDMVKSMARAPLILAMANPEPEILPPLVKEVRPDAIIGTGRSDYPNQVNNVLCFPFIFRGALDVGATTINEEMKLATVRAIADLALAEQNDVVATAYGDQELSFGPEYVIPKPFDPRLIVKIAPAVAKAAMDSGVATRPIQDFDAYADQLAQFVHKTNLLMKPVFAQAKKDQKRVVLTEGEDERVLHATQEIVTQGLAKPILIGRPSVIDMRIQKLGLKLVAGKDFEIVNNESDPRFAEYWKEYYQLTKRKGVSQEQARRRVIGNTTLIGAMMVRRGDADAMICGTYGPYRQHFDIVETVLGYNNPEQVAGAMNALILPTGNIFIADTYVNADPSAEQLASITRMASESIALRHCAQGRAAVQLQLRHAEQRVGAEDARRLRPDPLGAAGSGNRRRNAGRRRAGGKHPQPGDAGQHAERLGQSVDHAECGSRQHQLQPVARFRLRRRDHRPHPDGHEQAGSHPDPDRFGAPHRQHGGAGRRGCAKQQVSVCLGFKAYIERASTACPFFLAKGAAHEQRIQPQRPLLPVPPVLAKRHSARHAAFPAADERRGNRSQAGGIARGGKLADHEYGHAGHADQNPGNAEIGAAFDAAERPSARLIPKPADWSLPARQTTLHSSVRLRTSMTKSVQAQPLHACGLRLSRLS